MEIRSIKKIAVASSLLLVGITGYSQSASPFGVHYMVDYDVAQQAFTAWVVPQYSTPNRYNSDSEEKGATAQVTMIVLRA